MLASSAIRHAYPLGVLMVDIDNFKHVNDTAGHAAGDAVLCVIAARLKASMRTEDVLGRWGGEEFLALLPYSDLHSAAALAERLRVRVGTDPLAVGEGEAMHITISVGCAAGDGHDPEELVRQGDACDPGAYSGVICLAGGRSTPLRAPRGRAAFRIVQAWVGLGRE